jgi:hypothetical protein
LVSGNFGRFANRLNSDGLRGAPAILYLLEESFSFGSYIMIALSFHTMSERSLPKYQH